jgi:hypothetical protein
MRDVQGFESQEVSKKKPPTPGTGDEPGDKGGDVEVHSTGKESLNTIAQKHHTSAAQIISTTRKHHQLTSKLASYINRHRFNMKLPNGIILWVPEPEDEAK